MIRRISKTSNMSRTRKKEKQAYKPTVLASDNDEWLTHFKKNLRQVETESSYAWASDLICFIAAEQENFVTSKFMSEMFNLKFVLGQKTFKYQRRLKNEIEQIQKLRPNITESLAALELDQLDRDAGAADADYTSRTLGEDVLG